MIGVCLCAAAILAGGALYSVYIVMLLTLGVTATVTRGWLATAALVVAVLAPAWSVPTLDRGVLLGCVSALVWSACRWRARARDLQSRRAAVERTAAAARAVYDERLRIARDLHDMVSHGMSVITIQAEYGALRAEQDPAAARQALLVVEETGRETLWQLRQLVDVLRTPASPDGDRDTSAEDLSLSPTPGLEDLPDLLTRTAAAGLRVDYEIRGELSRVPAGVGLCVFRVVQEGVANVLQHTGTDEARLLVEVTDDEVGVRLTNRPGSSRPAPASAGNGHGLVGIRERVHLLGGRARVGPTADGGYDLEVLLPVLHRSAETTAPLPS